MEYPPARKFDYGDRKCGSGKMFIGTDCDRYGAVFSDCKGKGLMKQHVLKTIKIPGLHQCKKECSALRSCRSILVEYGVPARCHLLAVGRLDVDERYHRTRHW
ncbi:uncharacterized protein LOC121377069 [Gigantopelta aegis]|uniref:uncharacterized protein LOC121377069 n=1 Tax=Gigantopelta aegis TaxID=1735272 RepID=UPI001B88AAF9|nr:uncharacterized protein LOC121377069 [Gigantopelta aegis]